MKSVLWRALCTKITEVNLSAFVYRLFHADFSPFVTTNLNLDPDLHLFPRLERHVHEAGCKQMQIN